MTTTRKVAAATPRTLALSNGAFDQDTSFTIEHPRAGRLPIRAKLHQDYKVDGDGIYWALQIAAVIKSQYTDADRAEAARLSAETPLRDGDTVLIHGDRYTIKVKGDFSDCAVFERA